MPLERSCLKKLEQGELLFKDGEKASSLFIIQSGQIRLFKPKGEGYVEIALLRGGEVVGEMAFFDEEKGHERSCSAEALIPSEVIEVSFTALEKTIQGLNPWFKLVFSTMADRLRKTNMRVKSLESNNVSHGFGADSIKNYKFFMTNDVIRSLSVLFLVMKSHGEKQGKIEVKLNMNILMFYAQDIFNIAEVKFLEFCHVLGEHDLCSFLNDESGDLEFLTIKNIAVLRNLMIFFNTQKASGSDKQIKVSNKCEFFLDRIIKEIKEKGLKGNPVMLKLNEILADFKERGKKIEVRDLEDARKHGLIGDVAVSKGGDLSLPVNMSKIKKIFIAIKIMNAVERFNKSKQKQDYYG